MADTGSAMNEATLARALEPFFSTKDVGNPMNKVIDCRAMELWCIERAKADPKNSWKWLGQAERWQELGHSQVACRFRPAKCPVRGRSFRMGARIEKALAKAMMREADDFQDVRDSRR
jgi:hypothetical protein